MSTKIKGNYNDNLRCSLQHVDSKEEIYTDAPKDNNGRGESFSPTDLLAAGLGSCMITIIAIRANARKINIGNPTFHVEKHMKSNPREIERLSVDISFTETISMKDREYLEGEAKKCPVALSLNPNIKQEINFKYG